MARNFAEQTGYDQALIRRCEVVIASTEPTTKVNVKLIQNVLATSLAKSGLLDATMRAELEAALQPNEEETPVVKKPVMVH